MIERSSQYENFWPSFADMMLSVVLVFLIIIFLLFSILGQTAFDVEYTQKRQIGFMDSLAYRFASKPETINPNLFIIPIRTLQGKDSIRIYQKIDRLILQFSGQILFKTLDHNISASGRDVLRGVGTVIRKNLDQIAEIQILGFADTEPIMGGLYSSNLHLGSYRANEVFFFLKDSVHIDPVINKMSATSYGEYFPVQRMDWKGRYSWSLLATHNADTTMRALNRRIEIQLFFQTASGP